ncbi:MAG TPA: hypothetical protein VMU89_05915 [Thermomicrobiaceae bacterium]|nr:hypothetical protein [Thermomicrobiaceae bacterium]
MNLHTLETVVRRLYADAEFRKAVVSDPVGALSEYRLVEAERVAVTKLSVQMAGGPSFYAKPAGFWQ